MCVVFFAVFLVYFRSTMNEPAFKVRAKKNIVLTHIIRGLQERSQSTDLLKDALADLIDNSRHPGDPYDVAWEEVVREWKNFM